MVVMVTVPMGFGEFALTHAAIIVGIKLAEKSVGALRIDSGRPKRLFEFRLADLAVSICIELRKQIGGRLAHDAAGRLTLQRNQRR